MIRDGAVGGWEIWRNRRRREEDMVVMRVGGIGGGIGGWVGGVGVQVGRRCGGGRGSERGI